MFKTILAVIGAITVVYHLASGYDAYLRGKYEREYRNTKPAA